MVFWFFVYVTSGKKIVSLLLPRFNLNPWITLYVLYVYTFPRHIVCGVVWIWNRWEALSRRDGSLTWGPYILPLQLNLLTSYFFPFISKYRKWLSELFSLHSKCFNRRKATHAQLELSDFWTTISLFLRHNMLSHLQSAIIQEISFFRYYRAWKLRTII